MTIPFPEKTPDRNKARCRAFLVLANILVAGTLGFITGRWVYVAVGSEAAQAAAGFIGYMSVLALDYGRVLTKTYAVMVKLKGPSPWA